MLSLSRVSVAEKIEDDRGNVRAFLALLHTHTNNDDSASHTNNDDAASYTNNDDSASHTSNDDDDGASNTKGSHKKKTGMKRSG